MKESVASAPPLGVLVGSGDTFLNYTEAQQDMVESSGGLYGAEDEDMVIKNSSLEIRLTTPNVHILLPIIFM